MRFLKYLGIWLATVLAAAVLANFAGGIVVNLIMGKELISSMIGYSAKMQFPLKEPADNKEYTANRAAIFLRPLLDNEWGIMTPGFLYHFMFMNNTTIDQSLVFLNAEGRHDFSSGNFTVAYLDIDDSTVNHVRHPVGLVDIREWSQQEGCRAVYDVLEQDSGAVMRLDAYTVRDFKVQPVQLTLLDSSGKELLTQEFEAEGDVVRAKNCYLKNEAVNKDEKMEQYTSYCVYGKLALAYGGERECDRIAEELADKVPLGQDGYDREKTRIGLMKLTCTYEGTREGCTEVVVMQFGYWQSVVFYTVLLGAISAVILLIVFIRRR